MSDLEIMEKNLEQLKKEEQEIVNQMVNVKMEMEKMSSSENEAEIKEKKVELYDLGDQRADCVDKLRKLESEMAEWNEEAERRRKKMMERDGLKMENTSSLFQNGVNSATNGLTSRNAQEVGMFSPHANSEYPMKCKTPRYRRGDDFYTFLQRYEQWALLCGVRDNLDLRLASQIEDDAVYKKVSNIRLSTEERCDIRKLITAVKKELYPATDARIMRTSFHQMKQESLESVEQFAQRIQDTAEKIYPNEVERDSAAITALIQGISDLAIKRRLLQMNNETESFSTVTRLAVQEEHISKAVGVNLGSEMMTPLEYSTPAFSLGREKERENAEDDCQKCGKRGHTRESCWSDITCQLCNKKGHVASVCNRGANPASQSSGSSVGGRRQLICYNCNGVGHIQRFCNATRGQNTVQTGEQNGIRRGVQHRPTQNEQRRMQRDHLNGRATGQNRIPASRN